MIIGIIDSQGRRVASGNKKWELTNTYSQGASLPPYNVYTTTTARSNISKIRDKLQSVYPAANRSLNDVGRVDNTSLLGSVTHYFFKVVEV